MKPSKSALARCQMARAARCKGASATWACGSRVQLRARRPGGHSTLGGQCDCCGHGGPGLPRSLLRASCCSNLLHAAGARASSAAAGGRARSESTRAPRSRPFSRRSSGAGPWAARARGRGRGRGAALLLPRPPRRWSPSSSERRRRLSSLSLSLALSCTQGRVRRAHGRLEAGTLPPSAPNSYLRLVEARGFEKMAQGIERKCQHSTRRLEASPFNWRTRRRHCAPATPLGPGRVPRPRHARPLDASRRSSGRAGKG